MRRYKVTYKEGSETKIGALVAANDKKALKVFSFKFPEIPVENIISLAIAEKDERIDSSVVTQTESSSNTIPPHIRLATSPPTSDSTNGGDYNTSIVVAKIVSFIGWVNCLVALIFVLVAIGNAGELGMLLLLSGIGVFIGGLLLVVAGQFTRATIDNTIYSREMLMIMRNRNL